MGVTWHLYVIRCVDGSLYAKDLDRVLCKMVQERGLVQQAKTWCDQVSA